MVRFMVRWDRRNPCFQGDLGGGRGIGKSAKMLKERTAIDGDIRI